MTAAFVDWKTGVVGELLIWFRRPASPAGGPGGPPDGRSPGDTADRAENRAVSRGPGRPRTGAGQSAGQSAGPPLDARLLRLRRRVVSPGG